MSSSTANRAGHGDRHRCIPILTALVLVILVPRSAVRAETVNEAYAGALKDHYDGRYARAVEELERIRALPLEHEDLHYNLGCAYFRLGRMGPAIYHFERALQLDPAGEDARFNLEASRARVTSRVKDEVKGAAGDPLWVRAVSLLRPRPWATLFLGLWWAALGILFARRYLGPGPLRSGLMAGGGLLLGLALVCGALLGGRAHLDARVKTGIVLPDRLEVREGPDPSTKVSFPVHAGLRVQLQSRGDGWVRIRLANGLEGWVPSREIGAL